MAVPKKKTSRARRNQRRAHHAISGPGPRGLPQLRRAARPAQGLPRAAATTRAAPQSPWKTSRPRPPIGPASAHRGRRPRRRQRAAGGRRRHLSAARRPAARRIRPRREAGNAIEPEVGETRLPNVSLRARARPSGWTRSPPLRSGPIPTPASPWRPDGPRWRGRRVLLRGEHRRDGCRGAAKDGTPRRLPQAGHRHDASFPFARPAARCRGHRLCRPQDLLNFAILGGVFAKRYFGLDGEARVGLLTSARSLARATTSPRKRTGSWASRRAPLRRERRGPGHR